MMRFNFCLCFILIFCGNVLGEEPIELSLWQGKAPGSENWSIAETVTTMRSFERIVRNVVDPTLTVFLPESDLATGAGIVIAPGGALRVLGIDNEGVKVARWLNSKGIAAFVLKYRTLQVAVNDTSMEPPPMSDRPRQELEIRNANANPEPNNKALSEVLQMAVADAQQALRLVRRKSKQWNVDTHRVGFMGFSAGGGIAVGAALAKEGEAYPDFLVSLYGPSLMDVNLPDHAPPLFIAVGSTHFNVTNGCLALFRAWNAAGKPAEIHIYDGVSAGFGMSKIGSPVDDWNQRLLEWMVARKIISR